GSPGLTVERADHLGLDRSTTLFAAAVPGDPIARTQWFGIDPTSPEFGATVLDARAAPHRLGPGMFAAHGPYFDPASTSLANLARVTTGARPTPAPPSPSSVALAELVGRGRWARLAAAPIRLTDDFVTRVERLLAP